MKKDILTFVFECNKGESVNPPRATHPFPLITSIWIGISMDFIISQPKASNKPLIMLAVDHLSMYAHLCALPHPFTHAMVAQILIYQNFKLRGMPTSIVYDRDPT